VRQLDAIGSILNLIVKGALLATKEE